MDQLFIPWLLKQSSPLLAPFLSLALSLATKRQQKKGYGNTVTP
jgi:hypothetical protein